MISKAELRKWLAEQLGGHLPIGVWKYAIEEGLIEEVLIVPDKENLKTALFRLRRAVMEHMAEKYPERKPRSPILKEQPVRYDPHDLLMTRAFTEYIAVLAGESPEVRTFRESILGGSPMSTEDIDFWARAAGGKILHVGGGPPDNRTAEEKERDERQFRMEHPYPPAITLTEQEAYGFVESLATRVMSLDQFREWGESPVGHKVIEGYPVASFSSRSFGRHNGQSVTLTFQSSGNSYVIRAPNTREKIDGHRLVRGRKGPDYGARLSFESIREATLATGTKTGYMRQWAGKLTEKDKAQLPSIRKKLRDREMFVPTERDAKLRFERELLYPERGGFTAKVSVWPGSVLDELRSISNRLADRYGWHPADATWFILTGKTPWIEPFDVETTRIGGTHPKQTRLSLRILPWVSLKSVHKWYRGTQERYGFKQGNRGDRALEVFIFVTSKGGVHINRQDAEWKNWFGAWNRQRPGEEFKAMRYFKQEYLRGREILLGRGDTKAQ